MVLRVVTFYFILQPVTSFSWPKFMETRF